MSAQSRVSLLAPGEPPAFEVVNPGGASRSILVCDHASARLPRALGTLGLGRDALARHIAWDIGALEVAGQLAGLLDAPLVATGYSRLVIDCNRPLSAADAFPSESDDVQVPGNERLTKAEREARAEHFFWPYHDAIDALVAARAEREVPVLVSVHSFTPVHRGRRRPWDVGVQYRLDRRLAAHLLAGLRADSELRVGDNEPYRVALDEDFTVPVHAEARGLPYVLVEIRQDHIASQAGAREWAERLAALLAEALDREDIQRFGPPAADIREPRYARGDRHHAAK